LLAHEKILPINNSLKTYSTKTIGLKTSVPGLEQLVHRKDKDAPLNNFTQAFDMVNK